MLRLAFIALLLANAGYYAWSGGWLRGWGLAPADPAEPQAVTPRQALAIIGSGFVGMARLGYGSIYESDSGARAIMDGTVPEAVVDALATLGEHGLRNMGGGR